MPLFHVTFEDKGFTRRADLSWEINARQGKRLLNKLRAQGLVPACVEGIIEAHVADDGDVEDGDRMVFVPVTLAVRAESMDEAEAMAAPRELLEAVTVRLQGRARSTIAYEGNWEHTECELATEIGEPPAGYEIKHASQWHDNVVVYTPFNVSEGDLLWDPDDNSWAAADADDIGRSHDDYYAVARVVAAPTRLAA